MTTLPRADLVQAYSQALGGPAGEAVLGDLVIFCCAQETTAKPGPDGKIDPIAMAVAEGRRQVLMHVTAGLNMDQSKLWQFAEAERQQRRAALAAA